MVIDIQIRNRLLRKIQRISGKKLKEIDDFVSKIEENASRKEKNMSFAGTWENIDENLFRKTLHSL
jgi:hypothetical protein